MALFSLVHGAWGGGWCWELLRRELEGRGHVVHAPDLPCEDVTAGVVEYAAAIPPADVAVGYSLGGPTVPFVAADTHVFLTALVAGTGWEGVSSPDSATNVHWTSSDVRTIQARAMRSGSCSSRPSTRTSP